MSCGKKGSEGRVRGQGLSREEARAKREVGCCVTSGGETGGWEEPGGGCVPMKGHSPMTGQLGRDQQAHQKSQGRGSNCLTCLD